MNSVSANRRVFFKGCVVIAVMLMLTAIFQASARAETLVDNVNFLIPFGHGASFDRTCRGSAATLISSGLVKAVKAENVVGRGGANAYEYLENHQSEANNTLLLIGTSILARKGLGQFPYNVSDLSMVSLFSAEVLTFAVKADSPIKSMRDIVVALKSDPASLKFASDSDPGLSEHLCVVKMLSKSGIAPKSVTYLKKKGHKHIEALLNGEVDVVIASSWDILDQYHDKSVRVLAVSSDTRVEQLPDIPTLAEVGMPSAVFYNARWFFMASKADAANVKSMGTLLEKMVQTSEWKTEQVKENLTMLFALPPKGLEVFNEQCRDIMELQAALGLQK